MFEAATLLGNLCVAKGRALLHNKALVAVPTLFSDHSIVSGQC